VRAGKYSLVDLDSFESPPKAPGIDKPIHKYDSHSSLSSFQAGASTVALWYIPERGSPKCKPHCKCSAYRFIYGDTGSLQCYSICSSMHMLCKAAVLGYLVLHL